MLLGKAVAEGEVEIVRDLLARGADPNRLEEDSSPIEWAMTLLSNSRPDVVRDVFACIELCLDAGALPDGPTDSPESCRRRNENRTSRVHVSSARSLSSG